MAAAADLQTKNTVLANLNQAGIDPGICAELKLRSGKGRTQLNLQIRRTYNLDLTAVGIGTSRYDGLTTWISLPSVSAKAGGEWRR